MSSSTSEALLFFALVINGGLAGAIYALIALAFVLVYKASHMINFALGEWIMFGALLASTGSHTIGLDLGGSVLFGCVCMALLGVAFNAIVLGRLVTRPVISLIMVTLGLGALMRGVAALCFRGVPGAMTLPISTDPISFFGIDIAGEEAVPRDYRGDRVKGVLLVVARRDQSGTDTGVETDLLVEGAAVGLEGAGMPLVGFAEHCPD
jgi:branched-subunit amino acid ABC-type transport system permease component